jgi:hypothetical protein
VSRLEELDGLIALLPPTPVDHGLPRLQLVTVTELQAICPVCNGPRRWARATCSQACAKVRWHRAHDRREYFKARRRGI